MSTSSASENNHDLPKKSFMSTYMSNVHQSQDSQTFLQQNQPTFTSPDQPASKKGSSGSSGSGRAGDSEQSSSSSSTATLGSTTGTTTATATKSAAGFDEATTVPGLHPLPTGHSKEQRQAIHSAALDNCADLNLALADCLMGRAGTWWDRASMCMKQKERFSKCCQINKEILTEREYGKEGNTQQQDQAILDYADKIAQERLKDEK